MSVLMASILFASTIAASISVATGEFSGQVQLYRDTSYRHLLALFAFSKSNRCFNMACGDYNDVLSSVEWSGLPTSASYDGETTAQLVFYVDTDCTGKSKTFPTSLGSVSSFADYDINDAISSFTVLETSDKIENGETSICPDKSRMLRANLNVTNGVNT